MSRRSINLSGWLLSIGSQRRIRAAVLSVRLVPVSRYG